MNGAAIRGILIATGALCALLSVLAIFDQAWEMVYGWLGLALVTETALLSGRPSSPGTSSSEVSPAIALEHRAISAISFLTSVFVPVVAILHAGFLDGIPGVILAGLVILSAVYRLAFHDWATPVTHFEGLPAAWGIAGFGLHAFDATPLAAALAIGTLLILTLVPVSWPHPLQSSVLKAATRCVTAAWAVAAASTLWRGFPATGPAKVVLLTGAVYGLALMAQSLRVNGFASLPSVRKPPVLAAFDTSSLDTDETTGDPNRK